MALRKNWLCHRHWQAQPGQLVGEGEEQDKIMEYQIFCQSVDKGKSLEFIENHEISLAWKIRKPLRKNTFQGKNRKISLALLITGPYQAFLPINHHVCSSQPEVRKALFYFYDAKFIEFPKAKDYSQRSKLIQIKCFQQNKITSFACELNVVFTKLRAYLNRCSSAAPALYIVIWFSSDL